MKKTGTTDLLRCSRLFIFIENYFFMKDLVATFNTDLIKFIQDLLHLKMCFFFSL